jgi:hypothetical protein
MLVNYLICGTLKGGTSALYDYFKKHPEIYIYAKKEAHFFNHHDFFKNKLTIKDAYDYYHSLFPEYKLYNIIGEATPCYMYLYDTVKRIWEYNPNMKIIIILRNPIERAYSQWNMNKYWSVPRCEHKDFLYCITNELKHNREKLPYQCTVRTYVDRGFYCWQIRRLWHYFSKENVFIVKNDDLRNNHQEILNGIFDFLGVKHLEMEHEANFSLKKKVEMSKEEKDLLLYAFEYEIKQLERMLNWDCSNWLI